MKKGELLDKIPERFGRVVCCLLDGLLAICCGSCLTFGTKGWQGRHLVTVGQDWWWLTVVPAKVGHIWTFGTRNCRSCWVVVA